MKNGDAATRDRSWPFDPYGGPASNFSLQYHPWMTDLGHKNKENGSPTKEVLDFEQIFLVSCIGNMFLHWELRSKADMPKGKKIKFLFCLIGCSSRIKYKVGTEYLLRPKNYSSISVRQFWFSLRKMWKMLPSMFHLPLIVCLFVFCPELGQSTQNLSFCFCNKLKKIK